jgi:hypothetical protein
VPTSSRQAIDVIDYMYAREAQKDVVDQRPSKLERNTDIGSVEKEYVGSLALLDIESNMAHGYGNCDPLNR